jgi:hypothetical protein
MTPGGGEDIQDALLSKGHVLAALRFHRSLEQRGGVGLPAHRFLDHAARSGDDMLFFTGMSATPNP